jgi:hypothetical protein
MAQDERDLLDLLTFELKFLEDGGYGRSPRTPWIHQRTFEDSISCPNFRDPSHPHPCSECWLMRFVPSELKDQDSACRLIPLNDKGETIDYFYRYGTQLELEEALAGWLRNQIKQIEEQRKAHAPDARSGNELDHIRRKQWLALAGNLYTLANRHRANHDYAVAHALYGRALALAENVSLLEDAERALVSRIRADHKAVSEVLHGGDRSLEPRFEEDPSEELESVAP